MSSQPVVTKEPLTADLTDAQIQTLIAERKAAGGECKVETQGNQRTLVCNWPRLK